MRIGFWNNDCLLENFSSHIDRKNHFKFTKQINGQTGPTGNVLDSGRTEKCISFKTIFFLLSVDTFSGR